MTHLLDGKGARCSSVSIVSDYGLDDRVIEFRSLAEANDFSSSLCVQTGSGTHPTFCTMGTGGPFPGVKAQPERDADHSPHLMPRSRESRSYSSSPPRAPPWRVVGLLYFTFVYNWSRVSSGSIVSDYGLDDRAIGVRSPAGAEDFSSSLCPDRLWGPPSLLYNGYRGSFPRG
jgi:hypothetical protein